MGCKSTGVLPYNPLQELLFRIPSGLEWVIISACELFNMFFFREASAIHHLLTIPSNSYHRENYKLSFNI